MLSIDRSGANEENVTYVYDLGNNAVGRLSSIAEQGGSQSYSYDAQGYN